MTAPIRDQALRESAGPPTQLVILSGKGGTGKTSVTAALATLADHAVLADCDVDAADLHLLLAPRAKRKEVFMSGREASIIPSYCSACGDCTEHCRYDAIRLQATPEGTSFYTVDPLACEGCGLCARVCPCGAVEFTDAERGEWYVADTRHGPMVHARLNVGGENSGKLVTLVREEADRLARETGNGTILVDGPPGIGCPVIASTTGASLALVVTEPTVSGQHDLERVADLIKGFEIPLTVCINKVDLNPEMAARIRDSCAARNVPVVGELPYDESVVEAQVRGQSIVEYGDGPVAEEMRKMWMTLEEMLAEAEER